MASGKIVFIDKDNKLLCIKRVLYLFTFEVYYMDETSGVPDNMWEQLSVGETIIFTPTTHGDHRGKKALWPPN